MSDAVWGGCDGRGHGDPRGWWGMRCWGAMTAEQQETLTVTGRFEGYGGGTCDAPAQVCVETEDDRAPGPRFYCRPCALAYLRGGIHDSDGEQGLP